MSISDSNQHSVWQLCLQAPIFAWFICKTETVLTYDFQPGKVKLSLRTPTQLCSTTADQLECYFIAGLSWRKGEYRTRNKALATQPRYTDTFTEFIWNEPIVQHRNWISSSAQTYDFWLNSDVVRVISLCNAKMETISVRKVRLWSTEGRLR